MTNRTLVLVSLCALAAAPLGAAAESPKPLRTLNYDLQMSIGVVRSVQRDAIGTAGSTHGDFAGGSESKGNITVDVIAVTADGGLVADVREIATNRSRPSVRVAITAAGALSYDPKQSDNVTEEEDTLLRWLARGFVTAADRSAGTTWTIDNSTRGTQAAEHYRVVSAEGPVLHLDYKAESKSSGLGGGDMTRAGTLVYDTKLTVPKSASYKDIAHRQQLGSYDTTEMGVQLKLTSDSLAKK